MESSDASTLAATVFGRFVADIGRAPEPFVLGISALQGAGKSFLADGLVAAAEERGWGALAVSLDDVYLTRAERATLAADVHPLLRTRGVPGTHDLSLLASTLDALAKATPASPVAVPRFDKGRDDRAPGERWPVITGVPKLVVLEGWCLGVDPEDDAALVAPINDLERVEDADGRWRRWVNGRLATYATLWARIDALVVLQAPSWGAVAAWRDEAEQPLRDRGEPRAMDTVELGRFLQHYERISRWALASVASKADMVVRLDPDRRVIAS